MCIRDSGKALTTAQLDEAAKANNTYTGYYKINDEYYCLDENGTPRTGNVTLTVNGVAAQYYFQPAETDQEIPGKMYRDGWKSFVAVSYTHLESEVHYRSISQRKTENPGSGSTKGTYRLSDC